MPDSVLLRFASEEMIYLLRALHIADFPGLDAEPLKELADSEKSLLMLAADHTLRARGLVRWQGDSEREIDPFIAKVLLECSRPRYTLFLDSRDARLLHIFSAEMIVEQCEPEPGVQQYLVMASREAYQARLQGLIAPGPGNGPSALPGGQISLERWKEVLGVVRADEGRARVLLASSLPPQTAGALLEAIREPRQLQYLARWKRTPGAGQNSPEAMLTLVAGPNQLFLLWSEQPDNLRLTVQPARAEHVREYVARLLPPMD
jgi:hypothetical protein